MTFKEKFAINNNMSHDEIYTTIVNGLGYENVKQYVPFSVTEIAAALAKGDKHLNTLWLGTWDNASGYKTVTKQNYQDYTLTGTGLAAYVRYQGINCFSLSELVCILKRCAVMMVETTEDKANNDDD